MKAAAPQAPVSTHATAKTRSKGGSTSLKASIRGGFDTLLAKAVAAKDGKSPPAAGRVSVGRTPAADPKGGAARGSTANQAVTRGSRRTDGSAAVADPSIGRTAVSLLHAVLPAAGDRQQPAAAAKQSTRAEPRIQVVDLRTKKAADSRAAERTAVPAASEKVDGTGAAVRPFGERLAAAGKAAAPEAAARATPLERIRQMTGSDLARTVGIVVKDGGGEINLTLKPESLGSVRIRLSLDEGKVEGRIIVDTQEARRAFEAGIPALQRALTADGFQTGSLQVSVSGGNVNDGRQAAGLLSETIAGARLRALDSELSASLPPVGWQTAGDGLVNLFA